MTPPMLAVDAAGYCWRVFEDGTWSTCPTNPDNSPIPMPVTFYVPVGAPDWARLCAAAANLGAAFAEMDNARAALAPQDKEAEA